VPEVGFQTFISDFLPMRWKLGFSTVWAWTSTMRLAMPYRISLLFICFLLLMAAITPAQAQPAEPANLTLAVGSQARVRVTDGDSLRVRAEPGTKAKVLFKAETGITVTLVDGPQTADDLTWWKIQTADGKEGWTVAGVPEDKQFLKTLVPLCPYTDGRIAFVVITKVETPSGTYPDYFQDIYTSAPDGSQLCNLTQNTRSKIYGYGDLAWSPDGKRMLFVTAFKDSSDLFSINADGSGFQPITKDAQRYGQPQWSPDGSQIAYEVRFSRQEIWLANSDWTGRRPLIGTIKSEKWVPRWSPDGKQIAFVEGNVIKSGPDHDQLRIVNADGTNARVLAKLNTDYTLTHHPLNWSPDGKSIVVATYVLRRRSPGTLLLVDVASGESRPLTDGSTQNMTLPVWSPDGQWIAYWRNAGKDAQNYSRFDLAIIRPDGTDAQTLVSGATASERPVAWSPDSKQIMYSDWKQGLMAVAVDGAAPVVVMPEVRVLDIAWMPR
jgi:dipeptidyl aminopeptidase/acylaminoacyl peptidase